MKKTLYIFYALMPFLSVAGVLGVSWILAAFLEVFTNNLTMVKILNPYPSRVQQKGSGHLNKDTGFYPGNNKNNIFWFVQVYYVTSNPGENQKLMRFFEWIICRI